MVKENGFRKSFVFFLYVCACMCIQGGDIRQKVNFLGESQAKK